MIRKRRAGGREDRQGEVRRGGLILPLVKSAIRVRTEGELLMLKTIERLS